LEFISSKNCPLVSKIVSMGWRVFQKLENLRKY
jgi:hypothetical protein